MKKVLVTGSSGFIGSALAKSLLALGFEVIGIDSNNNYYSRELKELRIKNFIIDNGGEFLELDFSDRRALDLLFSKHDFDVVFHMGAQAGVRLKKENYWKYVLGNLTGFSNVIEFAVQSKVPRFLFASSSSVYGNLAKIPYVESEKNLNPSSFYGGTKLANEILTPLQVRDTATKARALRFFTVYGPWGRPDMAYFRIINSLLNSSQFSLNGTGELKRDFTFIDDCIQSIILLSEELSQRPPGFFDKVNVGGGNPSSMKELISVSEELTGSSLNLKISEPNLNDAALTQADFTYLMSLINFKPKTSLAEGVKKTIDWANYYKRYLDSWVKSSN